MAVDFTEPGYERAFWLISKLCMEAGVCLHSFDSNPVAIRSATYEWGQGLQVTNAYGQMFRLKVTATPEHEDFPERQEECRRCGHEEHTRTRGNDRTWVGCDRCKHTWLEPL